MRTSLKLSSNYAAKTPLTRHDPFLFITLPAHAQSAGDACSTANQVVRVQGAAGAGLICNGTTLEVYEGVLTTPLRHGIGTATPAAKLDVNGEVKIGNTTLACAAGTAGALRYNSGVLELCNGTSWGGLGLTGCGSGSIGAICDDGTVLAGFGSSGPIYVTRCDAGQTWNGATCTGARSTLTWNNGSVNYTDVPEVICYVPLCLLSGKAATAYVVAADSDSVAPGTQTHQAAQYCADLSLHGHTDWYLPSDGEMYTMQENHTAIGNFDTSGTLYWTVTEGVGFSQDNAVTGTFGALTDISAQKETAHYVRCARVN